jgi:SET domain-containing protein
MLINNKIYSKESDVHGYGVFAKEDINKGEIIEECPDGLQGYKKHKKR